MQQVKYKIAVIDDETDLGEILKSHLESEINCEVELFSNPVKALLRMGEQKFDAISLDHRMPDLSGMAMVKLLRTIKGPNQNTRILLFTSFIEEAQAFDPSLINEIIFLEKPIKQEIYIRWIKILLNNNPSKKID